jgi:DnaJ family protein A protein 2
MPDLYQTLGIDRSATIDDIRRSYKDLAKTHHPDRGGNAEKFKAIQNAYEVLSNDERRQLYDMTGSESEQMAQHGGMAAGGIPFQFSGFGGPGFPGMAFDMSEVFGNLFGGGPQRNQRRGGKGPNKHHDIGLRLADFYKGHEIKLKFNQARKCTGCKGSGSESSEMCGPCGGSGVRVLTRQIGPGMMAQTRAGCDVCGGEGKRQIKQCQRCHGKKMTEHEKMLEIQVKPGYRDGEQLTYPGQCSDALEYDSPGDVVLSLKRVDDKDEILDNYIWKQDDLLIRKQISYAESILGFSIRLDDHPSGLSPTFVWRSGPLIHGAILMALHQGMPKKDGSKGKLYVQVMITPPEPKAWSAEDAAKLQSVFGGVSTPFEESGAQTLIVDSVDSKLTV